ELPWRLVQQDGVHVYDPLPTGAALASGVPEGVPVASLAAGCHATHVAVTAEACTRVADATGLRVVCVSGGVFQNRLLTGALREALQERGFEVFTHQRVPPNDGGLSFGQAAVAAARTARQE